MELCLRRIQKVNKAKIVDKETQETWKLFGEGSQDGVALSLLSANRLRSIAQCLADVENIRGETAEVGVAGGGTSKLIALRKPSRKHWVCDTFAGLMDVGKEDPALENGMFHNRITGLPSYESVRDFLTGLGNVRFVRGYFPESAPIGMREKEFSFVHLDVDTYQSTLACFRFFEKRMASGGIMAIDDAAAGRALGVQSAWKELAAEGWIVLREVEQQVVVKFA